jgi:hypothetical protein
MRLDFVLDGDFPLFKGTPEETYEWLTKNAWAHRFIVAMCVGKHCTPVPVMEYLEGKA